MQNDSKSSDKLELPLDELHQLKYSQTLPDLIVRVFVPDLQFEPFQKDTFYQNHVYFQLINHSRFSCHQLLGKNSLKLS